MKKRPNVIFFVPDSYRGDVLGHLGNPAAVSPNLDRMVADGAVSYTNAFAQSPVCTPSRCSFMTGWYPHTHGHRSMRNLLKPHEPNLLSVMKSAGYQVWWGGKNDLAKAESSEDFLRYCDVKISGSDNAYADHMKHHPPASIPEGDPRKGAFLRGLRTKQGNGPAENDRNKAWTLGAADMIRSSSDDKPFFCFLPLTLPHPAYCVEEEYYAAIDPKKLPPRIPAPGAEANLPPVMEALKIGLRTGDLGEEVWDEVRRIYYGMCMKADDLFGLVVDALKERGIYDDTWIFFFSDHGDFTGDYSLPEKTHLTHQDCLLRVPLVIKPPKDVPFRGGQRTHLVELVDLTATLYDVLGIEPGYDTQGRSLADSLAGSNEEIRDAVFAEVGSRKDESGFATRGPGEPPMTGFYDLQRTACAPFQQEGSYAVMCRTKDYKYVSRPYSSHNELYDLKADPGETCNLAGRPEMRDTEASMRDLLLSHFLRTADVLPHQRDSREPKQGSTQPHLPPN